MPLPVLALLTYTPPALSLFGKPNSVTIAYLQANAIMTLVILWQTLRLVVLGFFGLLIKSG